jgi:hypothetical protein
VGRLGVCIVALGGASTCASCFPLPVPLFCELSESAICIVAFRVAICVVFRLAVHAVHVVFRDGSLGQWLGVAPHLLSHEALLPWF